MDAMTQKTYDLLTSVATSTDPSPGVSFLSTKAAASSLAAGHLEANPTLKDPTGKMLGHRLTDAGKAYLASLTPADEGTKEDEADDQQEDETEEDEGGATTLVGAGGTQFVAGSFELPTISNTRKSDYPADDLKAPFTDKDGKVKHFGFFVPPKTGVDPAKAYPAIASAANKRWADRTPIRKFTSRVMDGGAFDKKFAGQIGVGIFRTE